MGSRRELPRLSGVCGDGSVPGRGVRTERGEEVLTMWRAARRRPGANRGGGRGDMKRWWRRCAMGVLTTIVAVTSAAAGTADRPNIVYILADDLGWKDVGFHGSDIKTPNIDGLAAQGTRLEQFYAQPMCTPTRAALMTGRYPLRYGLQIAVIPDAGTYGLAPPWSCLLSSACSSAVANAASGLSQNRSKYARSAATPSGFS